MGGLRWGASDGGLEVGGTFQTLLIVFDNS